MGGPICGGTYQWGDISVGGPISGGKEIGGAVRVSMLCVWSELWLFVDFSIILLPYSISSSALENPDLLLSHSDNSSIAQHIAPYSTNNKPYIFLINQYIINQHRYCQRMARGSGSFPLSVKACRLLLHSIATRGSTRA